MKNIGVFFGSRNTEHDISIITAQLIISGLKGLEYRVIPIYINREGQWMVDEELGKLENFTDSSKNISQVEKYQEYYIDLKLSKGKIVLKKIGVFGETLTIDLAFPALHGTYGEDGTIQGLFEMFNVPYVGCDVTSSALAMDKVLTKQLCQINNIPTTKFIYFYKNEWEKNYQAIIDRIQNNLKWPIFIKPAHLGSSIGISKVKDKNVDNIKNKLEVAFYYDNKILVEEGISDLIDLTCCVIGNDNLEASLLQESIFQAELFNFEEKYLKEGGGQFGKSTSSIVIPAKLDQKITVNIQNTAKAVYRALDCSGIARVDFLYNKKIKEFFANEVNPLPGTLYHHLWKESGLELPELLKKLIDLAQQKHDQKQKLTHTFESNVLNNINSKKLNSVKLKEKECGLV